MSNRITYRKMTFTDVDAVYKLEVEAFTLPWNKEAFEHEMTNNLHAYYILAEDEESNEIVGYCGMWMIMDESHITNVAVKKTLRGHGIGEGLMREAIRVSREHQVVHMTLEVRVSNVIAQNLYRKLGFQNGGIRKQYYSDNIFPSCTIATDNG